MSETETMRVIERIPTAQTASGETRARWKVDEYANGPFGTMFGGLIAGVMIDSFDEAANSKYPKLASIHVDFVRPVRCGEIEVSVVRTRRARTMAWFALTLTQNQKTCAVASVIRVAPVQMGALPESPWSVGSFTPADLREADRSRPLEGPWFGDVLNYTVDDVCGQRWFAPKQADHLDLSPTGFAVTIADYAAGISRPDTWEAPAIKAFPNPMMSVVFHREPVPGWVGLQARSVWNEEGLGMAVTELLDSRGAFGASQQINMLIPLD